MKKYFTTREGREYVFTEEEVNAALSFYLHEKHDVYYGDEVDFIRRHDNSIVVESIDKEVRKESK